MTDKDNCNHDWIIMREAGPIVTEGRAGEMYPAVFKCQKCNLIMTASEALQLSALKNQKISVDNQTKLADHQLGFEKWRSFVALVFSGIALIISILTLINKF